MAQEEKTDTPPEAAEAAPEAPPAPTTGTIVVTVDQSGLSAIVGGVTQEIQEGNNTFADVVAGSVKIIVTGPAGKVVYEKIVNLVGGGTAGTRYSVFSTVKSRWTDAKLKLESADSESDSLRLTEGEHTLVLSRPGHYPFKGNVNVKGGQMVTLMNESIPLPDRSQLELWSWVGVGAGLAMVGAATALELGEVGDSGTMDAAKFALAGIGGVMFVTGGSLLKWAVDDRKSTKEGDFQVKIGAAPLKKGALVGAVGTF
jgi:hypothetical protein